MADNLGGAAIRGVSAPPPPLASPSTLSGTFPNQVDDEQVDYDGTGIGVVPLSKTSSKSKPISSVGNIIMPEGPRLEEFRDMHDIPEELPDYRDQHGMTDIERTTIGLPSIRESQRLKQGRERLSQFLREQEYVNTRVRWMGVRAMLKYDVTQKPKPHMTADSDAKASELEKNYFDRITMSFPKNWRKKIPRWEKAFLMRNQLFIDTKKMRRQHLKEWLERLELDSMRSKPVLNLPGIQNWYRGDEYARVWPTRGHYLYKQACVLTEERRQREVRRVEEILRKDRESCTFKPERNPRQVMEFYHKQSDIGKDSSRAWRCTPSFKPKPRHDALEGKPREVYEGFLRQSPDTVKWSSGDKVSKANDLQGLKERHAAFEIHHPDPNEDASNMAQQQSGVHTALMRDNVAHQKFMQNNHYQLACLEDPTGFGKVFPTLKHPKHDVMKSLVRQAAREKKEYVEVEHANVFHVEASPEMLAQHQERKKGKGVLDTGLTEKQKQKHLFGGKAATSAIDDSKLEGSEERAWRIAVHRMERMGNAPRSLVELVPTNKAETELAALEAIFADDVAEEEEEAKRKAQEEAQKAAEGLLQKKKVARAARKKARVPIWARPLPKEQNEKRSDFIQKRKMRQEMAMISPWERQLLSAQELQVRQLGIQGQDHEHRSNFAQDKVRQVVGDRTYAQMSSAEKEKMSKQLYKSLAKGASGMEDGSTSSKDKSKRAKQKLGTSANFNEFGSVFGSNLASGSTDPLNSQQVVEDTLTEGVGIIANSLGVRPEDVGNALQAHAEENKLQGDPELMKAVGAIQRASEVAARSDGSKNT
ncbi:unnamed protein product [Amoebophrya sp. A120]|nr:unnamed protein product [Amoebophrya sp. A120]|eukprot:GSA120T00005502001.1